MPDYVIGDVHGQIAALYRLLDRVAFTPGRDHLYCVGDLVNKGPRSAETLDFFAALGRSASCVLGNHDLQLLSAYYRVSPPETPQIKKLLSDSRIDRLVNWLRRRPLVIRNRKMLMIHAGLPPQISLRSTLRMARHAERMLRGSNPARLLKRVVHNGVAYPPESQAGLFGHAVTDAEAAYVATTLVNCREIGYDGEVPCGDARGRLEDTMAWFKHPGWRDQREVHIYFGHWAGLGGYESEYIHGLDTGCGKGGTLTLAKVGSGGSERSGCSG